MDKIKTWLKRRSAYTVSVLGLGGVLLLGLIGLFSLPQTRFGLFYMLIVAGAALWAGFAPGLFLSLVSATVLLVVEWHDLKGNIEPWLLGWNLGVRFGIFLFAAWAMAQLRDLTRTLEAKVQQRTAELEMEVAAHKRSAARLRESEGTLFALLNAVQETLLLLDPQGIVLAANETVARRLGKPLKELVGSSVFEHLPREVAAARKAHLDEAVRTRSPIHFEDDQLGRKIQNFVYPVLGTEGSVTKLGVFALDITERKRMENSLRENEQRLRMALEAASMITWEWNIPAGTIRYSDNTPEIARGDALAPYLSVDGLLQEVHPDDRATLTRAIQQTVAEGSPFECEYRVKMLDGVYRWIEAKGKVAAVENGKPVRVLGISQDITRRKEVEQQLRIQAQVLHSMAEAALLFSEDSTVLLANRAAAVIFGREQSEFIGTHLSALTAYTPEENAQLIAGTLDRIRRCESWAQEFACRRKDGTVFTAAAHLSSLEINGQFHTIVVGQDITERKRTAEALLESEAHYRLLFEGMREGVARCRMIYDDQGHPADWIYLAANPVLTKSVGITDLTGKRASELFPGLKESNPELYEAYGRVARGGQPAVVEVWLPPLNMWAHISIFSPEPDHFVAIGEDITQRKQAEEEVRQFNFTLEQQIQERTAQLEATNEALQHEKELAQLYLDLVRVAVVTLDAEGRVVMLNPRGEELLEYSESELLGQDWFDKCVPEEPRAKTRDAFTMLMAGKTQAIEYFENPVLTRSGAQRIVAWHNTILRDAAGNITGTLSVGDDITERLQVQAALKLSEARNRLLPERTFEGIMIHEHGRIVDCNLSFADMFGYTSLELAGMEAMKLVASESVELVRDNIQNQATERYEATGLRRDGSTFPMEIQARMFDQGDRTLRYAACRDITERKMAERLVREQLEQIAAIYQTAPVGLCLLDTNFRYVRINRQLAKMNGLPAEDHIGRTVREAVPHLADATEALCRRVIATGQPVLNVEITGETSLQSGVTRSWTTHWSPVKASDGRVAGVNVVVEETTERKRAEDALRESETHFRTLADDLPHFVWDTDTTGTTTYVNQRFLHYTGLSLEQTQAGGWLTVQHPDDAPKVAATWRHAVENVAEYDLESRFREAASGEYRWFRIKGSPVRDTSGRIARWVGSCTDIHEARSARQKLRELNEQLEQRIQERTASLKAANEALREQQSMLQAFYDSPGAGRGIAELAEDDLRVLSANRALAAAYGRTPESISSVLASDLPVPREIIDQWTAAFRQSQESGAPVSLEYSSHFRAPGTWGQATVCSLGTSPGSPPRFAFVTFDVTERKRIAEQLKQSEQRYRALAEFSPDAIFILNRDSKVEYVNSRAARLFGRSSEQLIGCSQDELFPPEKAKRHRAVVCQVFQDGQPVSREDSNPFPSGVRWLDTQLVPLLDEQGAVQFVMGVSRDITERKQAEEQLRTQARVLESMVEGVQLVDAQGIIRLTNPALDSMFGYGPGELVGRHVSSLSSLPPQKHKRLTAEILEHIKTGGTYVGEFHNRRKDGTEFLSEAHINVLELADRLYQISVRQDITERKRAEQELADALQFNHTLISVATVGIAAYKGSGQCVFANNALAQIVGGPRQQVEQHDFRQIAAWRTSGLLHFAETALKTGEPRAGEFLFTTSFGKKVILDAHLVPFRSLGEPHLLAMFHDLTQRRTLERQILDISDREQARIGQDIHDGLCQMLITAGFDINMLAQDLAGESSTAADRARRLAALLDTMIVEARHVSRGLYPVKLEDNGLASALHELAAGVSRRSKIHCVAQCPKPVVVTDNAANTHLYRIAQEAVNNALKHAQARRIVIRLSATAAQIKLTVTDDGRGIPAEPNDTAGMGLHIMAYRARALGGTLEIQLGTGGGTVVSCCVPLRKL